MSDLSNTRYGKLIEEAKALWASGEATKIECQVADSCTAGHAELNYPTVLGLLIRAANVPIPDTPEGCHCRTAIQTFLKTVEGLTDE